VHSVGCKISILYHDARSKIHQIMRMTSSKFSFVTSDCINCKRLTPETELHEETSPVRLNFNSKLTRGGRTLNPLEMQVLCTLSSAEQNSSTLLTPYFSRIQILIFLPSMHRSSSRSQLFINRPIKILLSAT
jgi:hypothetical protein